MMKGWQIVHRSLPCPIYGHLTARLVWNDLVVHERFDMVPISFSQLSTKFNQDHPIEFLEVTMLTMWIGSLQEGLGQFSWIKARLQALGLFDQGMPATIQRHFSQYGEKSNKCNRCDFASSRLGDRRPFECFRQFSTQVLQKGKEVRSSEQNAGGLGDVGVGEICSSS